MPNIVERKISDGISIYSKLCRYKLRDEMSVTKMIL